jgi:hypothetical protein
VLKCEGRVLVLQAAAFGNASIHDICLRSSVYSVLPSRFDGPGSSAVNHIGPKGLFWILPLLFDL